MSICFLTFTHSWKDLPGILSVSLTVNINEERWRPSCATGRLLILHDIQILSTGGSGGAGGSVCRTLLSKHYVQFVILPASDRALVFSAESLSTESNLFTIICKIKKKKHQNNNVHSAFLFKNMENLFGPVGKYFRHSSQSDHPWVRSVLVPLSSLPTRRRMGEKAVAVSSLAAAAPSGWIPSRFNWRNISTCSRTTNGGFGLIYVDINWLVYSSKQCMYAIFKCILKFFTVNASSFIYPLLYTRMCKVLLFYCGCFTT